MAKEKDSGKVKAVPIPTTEEEKLKALDTALGQIEKQ